MPLWTSPTATPSLMLYPLGIALSGKQRTPGGGTDLACMMGRETTLARVKAAIEKLNG